MGGADIGLCVGTIAHVVGPRADDDGDGLVLRSLPHQYDFVLITNRLLVITWGYFDVETGEVAPETTTVIAIGKVTEVTLLAQHGMTRECGSVASHQEIQLVFADGSSEDIPGVEDELSPAGCKRMAELLPALYSSMAN